MRGYIHVYTGNGKGKTTAAMGLAVRAAGAGLKVYIAQFAKYGEYSEVKGLKPLSDRITIEQFGCGRFIEGQPSTEDVKAANRGLEAVKSVLAGGEHAVVILDEANVAVSLGLISETALAEMLASKPEEIEIIITGRGATPKIMELADLVTDMKEIKHYFQNGVQARRGIEK
ncbi:MAG: cob(I)yrinic acid a,c-diamide adenosyltransferase [Desulfobacterales bacterium]|jgi:cob(I)alamin adenosyltransferase